MKFRMIVLAFVAALAVAGCADATAEPQAQPQWTPRGVLPASTSGAAFPGDVVMFVDESNRAAWIATAEAMAARPAPVLRQSAPVAYGGDCAALAAELGLSEAILWRESRCSWDAFNATGCGGRGCLGPAQVDLGHFAPVSPWNGNVPGSCADLDPNDPAKYAECVNRLPSSAWSY